MNKDVLSAHWSYLTKQQRRVSDQYVVLAEAYNITSRRLGDARNHIIMSVNDAGLEPPLSREQLRAGRRRHDVVRALGEQGITLLAAHDDARAENLDAMQSLRAEDNRIASLLGISIRWWC